MRSVIAVPMSTFEASSACWRTVRPLRSTVGWPLAAGGGGGGRPGGGAAGRGGGVEVVAGGGELLGRADRDQAQLAVVAAAVVGHPALRVHVDLVVGDRVGDGHAGQGLGAGEQPAAVVALQRAVAGEGDLALRVADLQVALADEGDVERPAGVAERARGRATADDGRRGARAGVDALDGA